MRLADAGNRIDFEYFFLFFKKLDFLAFFIVKIEISLRNHALSIHDENCICKRVTGINLQFYPAMQLQSDDRFTSFDFQSCLNGGQPRTNFTFTFQIQTKKKCTYNSIRNC